MSKRLERTEAQSSLDFVEARARALPESRARWTEVAGTFAMFDGVESPLTQTFGLGMTQPVSAADLERLETFFRTLSAPVFHEVSPLADPSAPALLNERGYEPFEFTSVMFQALSPGAPAAHAPPEVVRARIVEPDQVELWAQTMARGWSEAPGLGDFMLDFSRVSARKTSGFAFLAEDERKAIAAGGLTIHHGVALLAGASTVPEGRRRGAQNALLDARLRFAVEKGCGVAMMCALPGSASQRNAEAAGLQRCLHEGQVAPKGREHVAGFTRRGYVYWGASILRSHHDYPPTPGPQVFRNHGGIPLPRSARLACRRGGRRLQCAGHMRSCAGPGSCRQTLWPSAQ